MQLSITQLGWEFCDCQEVDFIYFSQFSVYFFYIPSRLPVNNHHPTYHHTTNSISRHSSSNNSPENSSATSSSSLLPTATTCTTSASSPRSLAAYCLLVEQCLHAAQLGRVIFCPQHGNLGPYFIGSADGHVVLGHIAPDSVLLYSCIFNSQSSCTG